MDDLEQFNVLSGYRAVWVFALFDLPVQTKKNRRDYTRFRKALIREGFMMLQFSVYARYCRSEDTAAWFRLRVQSELPAKGQVRLLTVTDRQFGKMEVYFGAETEPVEEPPHQYELF